MSEKKPLNPDIYISEGPDKGRVKDAYLAQDMAKVEDVIRPDDRVSFTFLKSLVIKDAKAEAEKTGQRIIELRQKAQKVETNYRENAMPELAVELNEAALKKLLRTHLLKKYDSLTSLIIDLREINANILYKNGGPYNEEIDALATSGITFDILKKTNVRLSLNEERLYLKEFAKKSANGRMPRITQTSSSGRFVAGISLASTNDSRFPYKFVFAHHDPIGDWMEKAANVIFHH